MAWTVGTAEHRTEPLPRRSPRVLAGWAGTLVFGVLAAAGTAWASGALLLWIGAHLCWSGLLGFRSARPPATGPLFCIRDIREGPVEVVARAVPPRAALLSPLTSTKCSFYEYAIEVEDEQGGQRKVVDAGSKLVDFRLKDITGTIPVLSEGIEIGIPPQLDEDLRTYDQTPRAVRERLQKIGLDPLVSPGIRRAIFVRETRVDPGDNVLVRGEAVREADGRLVIRAGATGLKIERWTLPTFMPAVPTSARLQLGLGAAALAAGAIVLLR